MKTLLLLFASLVSIAINAQNVNITFPGSNQNRNYQVVLDGASYFSTNLPETGRKVVTINNLSPGSHQLEVYRMTTDNSAYDNGSMDAPVSGSALYSKTFELRDNYDMNIVIRPNGTVTFSEKRMKNDQTSYNKTPMSSNVFNSLSQSIRAKRYQSDRINLLTGTFKNTTNNFTSSQVRQLLSYITNDNRRLELAKLSYSRVTDPANFTSVYDVLTSEANRDALDEYVISRGGNNDIYTNPNTNNNYSRTAMSETAFNDLLRKARSHFLQRNTVREVRNAFNTSTNYFSTYQVRQLLNLVTSESERLSLAKLAYARATDPVDFYQLSDLFASQASKNDLNNYIRSQGGTVVVDAYSSRTAVSDAAFTQIYNEARSHFFQKNTVADVRTAFNSTVNYYSTEQIRALLSLVSSETERLSLAKLSFARAADPANFSRLYDLFSSQAYRDDLAAYVRDQQDR